MNSVSESTEATAERSWQRQTDRHGQLDGKGKW